MLVLYNNQLVFKNIVFDFLFYNYYFYKAYKEINSHTPIFIISTNTIRLNCLYNNVWLSPLSIHKEIVPVIK